MKLLMPFLFLLMSLSAFAQVTSGKSDNTAINTTDSLAITPPPTPTIHSPKKAALMSTILPGSGQIYNKKYWKAPVIYAGAAALGYSLKMNQSKYIEYRNAYKVRLLNGAGTTGNYPKYSDSDLNTLQKYYHRYRDLSVIGLSLLYVLNIIDATVDAHLYNFNVNDESVSLNVSPSFIAVGNFGQYTSGISLSIRF